MSLVACSGWLVGRAIVSQKTKEPLQKSTREGGREGEGLTNGLGDAVLVVGRPVLRLEELDKLLLVLW